MKCDGTPAHEYSAKKRRRIVIGLKKILINSVHASQLHDCKTEKEFAITASIPSHYTLSCFRSSRKISTNEMNYEATEPMTMEIFHMNNINILISRDN